MRFLGRAKRHSRALATPLEMAKIADHAFRTAGFFITILASLR